MVARVGVEPLLRGMNPMCYRYTTPAVSQHEPGKKGDYGKQKTSAPSGAGAGERSRTINLLITGQLLCH